MLCSQSLLQTQALFRVVAILSLVTGLFSCHRAPLPPIQADNNISRIVGSNRYFTVIEAGDDETYENLARRFSSSEITKWMIAEANGNGTIEAGTTVVIPRQHENPIGVYQEGNQVVPILSYHRIDSKNSRMSVSPRVFDKQLNYLARKGFHVVSLDDFANFLQGRQPLPLRSIVITIDDGYSSAFRNAFPLLKKYGFKATLFVYTDFVNQGGLTWKQLREMEESGLIDIQPHSKSHADLTRKNSGESDEQYRRRVVNEVLTPRTVLESQMNELADSFAYPYGATNKFVVDTLKQADYRLGLTVRRGSNAFFSYPFVLKRAMIFGTSSMSTFIENLETFSPSGAYRKHPEPTPWNLVARKNQARDYLREGDFARALRELRIIDATSRSFESGREVWMLERKISRRVKTLVKQARNEIQEGELNEARNTLLAALRLNPHTRSASRMLYFTESRLLYASLGD